MRWLSFCLPALYLVLCVLSIVLIFTSTEPLVGIYLVFLAWPWSLLTELFVNSSSLVVHLTLFAAAFLLNAAILYHASRLVGRLVRWAFSVKY